MEAIDGVLKILNVTLCDDQKAQYQELLAGLNGSIDLIQSLPDYQPPVDLARFPRTNVHRASPEENNFGAAWVYKFSISDPTIDSGLLLSGKTISVKDCICIAGIPQILGTNVYEPWTPSSDATIVTRCLEAGAELVGTGNCENMCFSTSSFSSVLGVVENPYAPGYSAGGSSSGTAAVVGGGLVDLGLGADQAGSVRIPAAACGAVGLKPTYGLVPFTGVTSNEFSHDYAGPIARTVEDCARLLEAIAGYDGIDDRQSVGTPPPGSREYLLELQQSKGKDLSGFKIGLLQEGFNMNAVEENMKEKVLGAAWKFSTLGARVENVSMPFHTIGYDLWTLTQRVSATLNLQGKAAGRRALYHPELIKNMIPWSQEKFDKAFPSVCSTLIDGTHLMENYPALYPKCMNLLRRLTDEYDALFERYDILVLPTAPFVSRKHGTEINSKDPLTVLGVTNGMIANTAQFNSSGHPAMTLPIGFLPSKEDKSVKLPVGMQLVAGKWNEHKLFRAGLAWESAFDWKTL